MWLYGSGNDGLPPIRLYDYQPSRGGYHAEEFLKGFSGYLTCDGFNGYNKLKDVIRCGCLAHMRRYWHDALPGKSKKSPDKTANSHFPRPAGPHFPSSQGHIKRSALEIGRARGAPPC